MPRFFLFILTLLLPTWAHATYVKHASGLVLAFDADKQKAVIVAPEGGLAQPLRLVPHTDGTVSIAATTTDETALYLALSGSWNTTFQTDSTDDRAHFFIEETGRANYLRLRCKSNNKFLGTDHANDGSTVYADKNGTSQLHQWFLADTPDEQPEQVQIQYLVNPAAQRQPWEGWGVSLCWWANMCGRWDEDKVDQLVDWLVSPEGLNYSLFRYNIGGGDDPQNRHCTPHHMGSGKGLRAEMEGFKDSTLDVYHWDRDAAQRRIMLKIKERRPDAVFEAFSNSAPYYMTYSGCVAGAVKGSQDNLRPEFYEEFAHYLVDVCKHYKDVYGIEFLTLEPFNEPNTDYWKASGSQEGCHFDFASQIAFLRVLAPILRASGLSTCISASDETSVPTSVAGFKEYQKAGIMGLVDQWNVHTYTANIPARAQIGSLARSEGKTLWMSEVGSGGSGIAGNLSLMQKLFDDVRYIMPTAWFDWQYVEENNDQWCTVRASFSRQTMERVKSYYLHQHVSRFILPGYTIITSLNAQTLAAISPMRDKLVLVALNTEAAPVTHAARLLFTQASEEDITALVTTADDNLQPLQGVQLDQNGVLRFTLPAQSMTTIVIPVSFTYEAELPHADHEAWQPYARLPLTPDTPFLLLPQYNAEAALSTDDSGQLLLKGISLDSAQVWTLQPQGEQWQLRNLKGQAVAPTTAYYLQTDTDAAMPLTFQPVEDYFWRIMTDDTRSFDLKSEAYAPGTTVGQYAYGNSVSAGHRHWQLFPLPAFAQTDPQVAVRDLFAVETLSSTALRCPATFNLQGQRVPASARGLLLRRLPDGRVQKVVRALSPAKRTLPPAPPL